MSSFAGAWPPFPLHMIPSPFGGRVRERGAARSATFGVFACSTPLPNPLPKGRGDLFAGALRPVIAPPVAWNGQARGPAPTQPFVGAAPRGRPQHSTGRNAPANNLPPPVGGVSWRTAIGRGVDRARRSNTKAVDQAQPPNAPLRAAPLSLALPPRGEGIKTGGAFCSPVAWNGQARGPAPTRPVVGAAPWPPAAFHRAQRARKCVPSPRGGRVAEGRERG
jgi:hypothetical protein